MGGPFEKYKVRFDAWIAAEEAVPTYPEDLTAIILAEENSPYAAKNFELLNQLAEHVRGTYGVPAL